MRPGLRLISTWYCSLSCCYHQKLRRDKMGNESSLPLELGATFDADEIKRLGKR